MKNVIKFLPVMAILLGSGLALATTQNLNAHNVYWDGSAWQPIPSGQVYNCDESSTQFCTAYQDEFGNVSEEDISRGNRVLL